MSPATDLDTSTPLSEDALHTLPLTITAGLAPAEIAPNRGFMIGADGVRIPSIYSEPRICQRCGVSFTPRKPKGLSMVRRVPTTCSEACRRGAASKTLTGLKEELTATKRVVHTVSVDPPVDARPARPAAPKPRPVRRATPIERPPEDIPIGRSSARDTIKDPGTDLGRAVLKRRYAVDPPLSVEYLSARIGAHPNSFDGWMRGRVSMPAQKLALLANVLCCTMEELWYDR